MPGEIKLSKLHTIFQVAMGWEDFSACIPSRSTGSAMARLIPEWEMDDIDEEIVMFADLISESDPVLL